ncbi:MAG TPA: hypothetical protein IAB96_08715 [Candidatus Coprenecus pullicola]|nr:hypothetical protein [Candidatus Coprenecus pullicola]
MRRKCPERDLLLTVRLPHWHRIAGNAAVAVVVWGRIENLPRSGLPRGSDGILALIVRHFHMAGLYTTIYNLYDGY